MRRAAARILFEKDEMFCANIFEIVFSNLGNIDILVRIFRKI